MDQTNFNKHVSEIFLSAQTSAKVAKRFAHEILQRVSSLLIYGPQKDQKNFIFRLPVGQNFPTLTAAFSFGPTWVKQQQANKF